MIVTVDYGTGNFGSIKNMLRKLGHASVISSETTDIMAATRLILPGIGAFDTGMKQLKATGVIDALNAKVLQEKVPVLGICLGMQLMTCGSAEGQVPGLGWIDATCQRFHFDPNPEKLKVPHMGWNYVYPQRKHFLMQEMHPEPRFYFVHAYHVKCNRKNDILLQTHYGYDFTASFQKENMMGVQFHPEKSHKFGMRLLDNFVKLS